MDLEERFFHYIQVAHTALLESQEWERRGDLECAADEARVCEIYRKKAVIIMLNSPRIEAIVASNPIIRLAK
jgi:hypothetical protein